MRSIFFNISFTLNLRTQTHTLSLYKEWYITLPTKLQYSLSEKSRDPSIQLILWEHIVRIVLQGKTIFTSLRFLIRLWGSVRFPCLLQPFGLLSLTRKTTVAMECWNIATFRVSSKKINDIILFDCVLLLSF